MILYKYRNLGCLFLSSLFVIHFETTKIYIFSFSIFRLVLFLFASIKKSYELILTAQLWSLRQVLRHFGIGLVYEA